VFIDRSDRGSQYCAHDYQKRLKQFGMQSSIARKGDCCDNAPMENIRGTLKTELNQYRRFAARERAKRESPSTLKSSTTGCERGHGSAISPPPRFRAA